jgi:hypothetical protein
MAGRRRAIRQPRVKLPKLHTPDELRPGRHTARRQRRATAATPPAVRAVAAPPPPARVSRRAAPPRRLTALSDRPNVSAPGPRDRFAGADVEARVAGAKYERAQRAELREQAAAGGGKLARTTGGTRARGSGDPRARFRGDASSDELNVTARKLHPSAPTVRGKARRPSAPLREDARVPGARGRHTKTLPQPQLTGAAQAGSPYEPRRGRAAGHWFFGGQTGRPPQ